MLIIMMLQVIKGTRNKVATFGSVQFRNANIFVLCVIGDQKNQQLQIPLISLRSPFNVLHSVLVYIHLFYTLYSYNSISRHA